MDVINRFLITHGLVKTLLAITLFSVLLSVLLTYSSIGLIYGLPQEKMPDYLLIGAIVPSIVAPLVSFTMLKQILKIDRLEKKTRYLASIDSITGLYNHRAFYEKALITIQKAKLESESLHVLLADIDGFKLVNDTFGHLAGDLALKHIGRIITQTLRAGDIAGRVGGDEFMICLPNTTRDAVLKVGDRIVQEVSQSGVIYDTQKISLSLSFGLSSIDDSTQELESIIKAADQALYRAKKLGKNRVAE